jgi:hypothetical protein
MLEMFLIFFIFLIVCAIASSIEDLAIQHHQRERETEFKDDSLP